MANDSSILTNIKAAETELDDCARILGMLVITVPDDLRRDMMKIAASVGLAVKKVTLAKLLLQDKERRENGPTRE